MNIIKNLKNKIFSKETIISLLIIISIFIADRVSKINIINKQVNNDSLFINKG